MNFLYSTSCKVRHIQTFSLFSIHLRRSSYKNIYGNSSDNRHNNDNNNKNQPFWMLLSYKTNGNVFFIIFSCTFYCISYKFSVTTFLYSVENWRKIDILYTFIQTNACKTIVFYGIFLALRGHTKGKGHETEIIIAHYCHPPYKSRYRYKI